MFRQSSFRYPEDMLWILQRKEKIERGWRRVFWFRRKKTAERVQPQDDQQDDARKEEVSKSPADQARTEKRTVRRGKGVLSRLFAPRTPRDFPSISPCIRDRLYAAGILWLIWKTVEQVRLIRPITDPDGDILLHLLFYPLYRGLGIYHVFIPLLVLLGVVIAVSTLVHWVGNTVRLESETMSWRSGIFNRSRTDIEYRDIRSVTVTRNWWQMLMGTGDIYVSAGYGYDIAIRGVSRPWRYVDVLWMKKERSILAAEIRKNLALPPGRTAS